MEIKCVDRRGAFLGMPGVEDRFRSWYVQTLADLGAGCLFRDPWWSAAAAVGSRDGIHGLAATSCNFFIFNPQKTPD